MTRELFGLVVIFLAAFTLLALFTYSPNDPGLNRVVSSRTIHNRLGLVGAYWGGLLAETFGLWAYVLIAWCIWRALRLLLTLPRLPFVRAVGIGFLSFVLLAFLGSPWGIFGLRLGQVRGGGSLGQGLFQIFSDYVSSFGAYFLLSFLLVAAVQLAFGLTWENFWGPVLSFLGGLCLTGAATVKDGAQRWQQSRSDRPVEPKPRKAARREKEEADDASLPPILDLSEMSHTQEAKAESLARSKTKEPAGQQASTQPAAKAAAASGSGKNGRSKGQAASNLPMPPLDLLTKPPVQDGPAVEPEVCRQQAESLITCLNDFGIQGEVQRVVPWST